MDAGIGFLMARLLSEVFSFPVLAQVFRIYQHKATFTLCGSFLLSLPQKKSLVNRDLV